MPFRHLAQILVLFTRSAALLAWYRPSRSATRVNTEFEIVR